MTFTFTRTQTVVLAWILNAGSQGITEAELKHNAQLRYPLNCLRSFLKRSLILKRGPRYFLRQGKVKQDVIDSFDAACAEHGLKRRPRRVA